MNKIFTPRLIPALLAVAFTGSAGASGFQLLEQNASGLGNAYAGSAANAENASTVFYNPAGMTQLKNLNVSVGVNAIRPSFTFSNNNSTAPAALGGGAATGGTGGDAAGSWEPLPNAYMTYQLNDKLYLGLGFGAPFGLRTEYDDNWMGRYHSIKFDIKTYNINPSIAYKVNDVLSVGFGLNWQRIEAEYVKMAVVPTGLPSPFPPFTSSKVTNNLSNDAWGWNAGLTLQPTPETRIGLSYRSTVKHKASGDQTFALTGATTWAKADVTLPDTVILSATHQLNDKWEMLGDVSWTGWSSIPELRIASGVATDKLTVDFRDTWRVAIGANYRIDSAWKLKFGLAYDQSPVHAIESRTALLPDNDRTWFSFGVQYKPTKSSTFDVGYSYLKVNDTTVANNESAATRGLLAGSYSADAHIIGAQYSVSF